MKLCCNGLIWRLVAKEISSLYCEAMLTVNSPFLSTPSQKEKEEKRRKTRLHYNSGNISHTNKIKFNVVLRLWIYVTAQDQRICIPVDCKVYSSWQKKLIKKNILVVRLFILISHSNKKAVRCPKTFSQDQRQLALYYNQFSYWIHTASVVFVTETSSSTCFQPFFALFSHFTCRIIIYISKSNDSYNFPRKWEIL